MKSEAKPPSLGTAFAWASTLLAFGSVQGAIYLKSYWGRFGLDPFQYGDTHALALVGLTAVGATLAFTALSAVVGGYLGHKIYQWRQKHPVIVVAVAVLLCGAIVGLAFFVVFGIYLVLGMALSWIIIWLVHHSPDVPESVKRMPTLPYVALALAYVSLGSHYLGQRRAESAKKSDVEAVLIRQGASVGGIYRYAGRLGGSYVLYDPANRSVTVIEADAETALVLGKRMPAASLKK